MLNLGLHLGALMHSVQVAGNMWTRQHSNVPLPNWPTVPGEPDLEIMHQTEDAIPLCPRRVVSAPRSGSDGRSYGNDGDDGGVDGNGDE